MFPAPRRLALVLVSTCFVAAPAAQVPADSPSRVYEEFAALLAPPETTKWPDISRAARDQQRESYAQLLTRTRALAATSAVSERLSLAVIERNLAGRLQGEPFDTYMAPLQSTGGRHNDIIDTIASRPTGTVADYEVTLTLIETVPTIVDQYIGVLSEGLERGFTQSRRTAQLVVDQLREQSAPGAETTRVLAAFRAFPRTIPVTEQPRLRARAEDGYRTRFVPAWKKLEMFLATTYMPRVREEGGLSSIPGGAQLYEVLVRRETSSSATPGEIHALGLREVERIEAEMQAIVRAKGWAGSLQDYDARLLATPEQVFHSKEEMLAFSRDVAMTALPELPRLFARLPRTPFGIRAVPEDREATASNSYSGAPAGGPRGGWVNLRTYQPDTYTKGDTRSVTLHEGVPGHHLQRALQRELEGVPAFRRTYGFSAFVEGWALYAESLADDMGIFQDADSRYGRLAGERFRAARLVVDTGMHALGWSRQRALEYFMLHAPQNRWVEIDRYLARPSQALGYKMGELVFTGLRRDAERALGARFDIRAFHDVVLGHGVLPFDLLTEQVRDYIEKALARQN